MAKAGSVKVTVVSYSLSNKAPSLEHWLESLLTDINNFLKNGSDIILYPELFLLGLADFFKGDRSSQLREVSRIIEDLLLPPLQAILNKKEVLLCLGSGPREFNGALYNSSYIWNSDRWIIQDKLHLTPWEMDFQAGDKLSVFTFKNFKVAVLICYDIEQPSLALALKKVGVDLILVPSATSDLKGNKRINRCASARSVELGAAVFTAPLIGEALCDLVDHSEGAQGFFLPSQNCVDTEGELYSDYTKDLKIIQNYELSVTVLRELKFNDEETKPYFKKELSYVKVEES
jgi:predicted amidohydrolase